MKFEMQYMMKSKQGILLKEIIEAPSQAVAQEIFKGKYGDSAKLITTLKK